MSGGGRGCWLQCQLLCLGCCVVRGMGKDIELTSGSRGWRISRRRHQRMKNRAPRLPIREPLASSLVGQAAPQRQHLLTLVRPRRMRSHRVVVDPEQWNGDKGPCESNMSASEALLLCVASLASGVEASSPCHSPSRRSFSTASRRARAAAVSVCDWMRKYMWKCHSRFRLSTTVLRSVWGGGGVDRVTMVIVGEVRQAVDPAGLVISLSWRRLQGGEVVR